MQHIQIQSPWHRLLLFIGLVLLFSILSAFSGLLVGVVWLNLSLPELAQMVANPVSDQEIAFLRFYQFINQIGIFILPVLVLMYFTKGRLSVNLSLNTIPSGVAVVITILLVYVSLPFNGFLTELNENVTFSPSLAGVGEWMHEKEEQARVLIEAILASDSIGVLAVNMVVVALMPALGEELFFRGVLQKLFFQITNNVHWAVIISAFLFSFFHLQFFGFLPRFYMGLVLGYLFVFTQNLWIPILMHFINNGSSVLLYYLHNTGYIRTPAEDFGTTQNTVYIIGSGLMTLWLMVMLYQRLGTDRFFKKHY